MGKNITDVHFTRDTMEETSYERPYSGGKNGNKTLFPVSKRISKDTNVDCFDWLIFWLHGPGEKTFHDSESIECANVQTTM